VTSRTIGSLVDRAAATHGAKAWLHFKGSVTTFSGLKERADHAAGELAKLGVGRGDRVVFCAPNSADLIFQWIGANRLGAVFVPLNPRAPTADLEAVVAFSRPSALVLDGAAAASGDLAARAESTLPVAWVNEIAQGTDALRSVPDVTEDDLAVFIATSGTTGMPKLVMQSHSAYVLTGEGFTWWLGLKPDDRLMTTLPLFHVNAQAYSTLGSLAAGAELVLLERFSPQRFWKDAVECGATEVNAIGAMIEMLMRQPVTEEESAHSIRTIYTAPAFAEPRHREIERRFGTRVMIGYGLSESPYGAIWPSEGKPYGTMGRLRQHPDLGVINERKLINDDGDIVAAGEAGELLLRNPAVMKGYFELPEETASALDGGWLHTGDLVREDADGYLTFVSRKKHVIRRRGENMSAAEIESVLDAHAGVVESCVIGVPSELSDEDVKAFVVAAETGVTPEELWDWCRERLAGFKVPRYLEFLDELPHTATERIAKYKLPVELTGREHDAEALT
jgi:crotonobetaine/carnitine-CoA ligase